MALARQLAAPLAATYDAMATEGAFSPDAAAAGRRALRLAALALLQPHRWRRRAPRRFSRSATT